MEDIVALLVAAGQVGALGHQVLHDGEVLLLDGQHQRGPTLLVHRVEVAEMNPARTILTSHIFRDLFRLHQM